MTTHCTYTATRISSSGGTTRLLDRCRDVMTLAADYLLDRTDIDPQEILDELDTLCEILSDPEQIAAARERGSNDA